MASIQTRLSASIVARVRTLGSICLVSRCVVAVAGLTALSALTACGDGTGPAATPAIGVPATTMLPYQVFEATVGAGLVTTPTVAGSIGDVAISAARLTDSTVSIMVPPAVVGPQVLSLVTGGTTRRSTIQVGTSPAIADPAAALEAVADRIEAVVDAHTASLARPWELGTVAGIDTATLRTQLVALRQKSDQFRAALAALTPSEQAQVSAFFAANPALFAPPASGLLAPSGALSVASQACTEGKKCYDAVDKVLYAISAAGFTYVGISVAAQAASWLGGVLTKVTVEAAQIVSAGILIGWILNELTDMARAPVKAVLSDFSPSSIQASAFPVPAAVTLVQGQDLPVFRVGTATALPVEVTYRSLTAGDLASDADVSGVAKAFALVKQAFAKVAAMIPFYTAPSPGFPAGSLTHVVQAPPPAQLAIGAVSPAAFSATASAAGSDWMVRFANEKQGADHQASVQVRFTPPGLTTQVMTATVAVKPTLYRVASLAIPAPMTTVGTSSTLQLAVIARDSGAHVIPESELGARRATWSSAHPAIATVDPSTGVVTGVAKGVARITASLEDGRADVDITVDESCDANWVFGTWTAARLIPSDTPVPGWQWNSNVSVMLHSASLTINTDSTFTGSVAWWLTLEDGTGAYGPGGNPVSTPVDTRFTEGKLRIACTVSTEGVKTVHLETTSLTSRMYNTGSTAAPAGFEGFGRSDPYDVRLYQTNEYEGFELAGELSYYIGVNSSVRLLFRK